MKLAGFRLLEARYFNMLGFWGWLICGKLFRLRQLSQGPLGVFNFLSRLVFFFENIIPLPFGVSLILIGQRPGEQGK
jgi:hypothetical protein